MNSCEGRQFKTACLRCLPDYFQFDIRHGSGFDATTGGVRTGKRGRGAEGKEFVVIAAECSGKKRVARIRIQRIPDAVAESLEPFIIGNVAKESITVHTDGWKSYNNVSALGYKHEPRKLATWKNLRSDSTDEPRRRET